MGRDTLILIPAKAASTRVKRKNMQLLGGKPLLQWAIDAAIHSGVDADMLVSTEDEEIEDYVNSVGVEVLVRPRTLAVDPAGVVDVSLHALDVLAKKGRSYNTLIILLPTCPLRTAENVRDAYLLFKSKKFKFLMSVSEYEHTPFAAMKLESNGTLAPYFPEYIGRKSQQMPRAYRANGAIHILDVASFQKEKSYYAQPLLSFPMPMVNSVDIDTIEDLHYAEYLLTRVSN